MSFLSAAARRVSSQCVLRGGKPRIPSSRGVPILCRPGGKHIPPAGAAAGSMLKHLHQSSYQGFRFSQSAYKKVDCVPIGVLIFLVLSVEEDVPILHRNQLLLFPFGFTELIEAYLKHDIYELKKMVYFLEKTTSNTSITRRLPSVSTMEIAKEVAKKSDFVFEMNYHKAGHLIASHTNERWTRFVVIHGGAFFMVVRPFFGGSAYSLALSLLLEVLYFMQKPEISKRDEEEAEAICLYLLKEAGLEGVTSSDSEDVGVDEDGKATHLNKSSDIMDTKDKPTSQEQTIGTDDQTKTT